MFNWMKYLSLIFFCSMFIQLNAGRAIFRAKDFFIPTLKISWENEKKRYTLQDSHLEEWPLFHTFDKNYFQNHLLPTTQIAYRHQKESVEGSQLSRLIQSALDEICQGKKTFTHFSILKKRDFYNNTGLIILKFKNYPFVVKIFIETPESFIYPCDKGFEATCFFYMGGGMNRHIAGFTRIKNLEHLQKKLAQHPYWHNKISFPRKWFWTPPNTPWLLLEGKNIGKGSPKTEIPSVYAVVADYIDFERTFKLTKRADRRTAFALSSYLESAIDAHINNYVIERGTKKLVILDTEHFPTLVGLQKQPPNQSYLQWYSHLAAKMLHDVFGRNKQERYAIQKSAPSPLHIERSIKI